MSFELKWDHEKNKMVKIRKKDKHDDVKGEEDSQEVSTGKLKKYIKNEFFILNDFDSKTLNKELPLSRKDRNISVDVYIKFLEDYLNRIRHGRKPLKSYYISAPDSFGKKIFAYQVIKDSLAHGFEPSEILTSQLMYLLLAERKYKEFYNYISDKDIVILTTGGAPVSKDLIVMKTVLEFCERNGTAVLILSRFTPLYLHKEDPFSSFYLGVRATKKGDYGKAELKGFNAKEMTEFKHEVANDNPLKDRGSFRGKGE